MKGIKITKRVGIKSAGDNDYVVNTEFLGGMKINETKVLIPSRDMSISSTGDYFYLDYLHGLNFVPASICFQAGIQGTGWQNAAIIGQPSVNADNHYVHIVSSINQPNTSIYVIIFGEAVAN